VSVGVAVGNGDGSTVGVGGDVGRGDRTSVPGMEVGWEAAGCGGGSGAGLHAARSMATSAQRENDFMPIG
jgi:hypothetical protein